MSSVVWAVANQKGGVGKTALALHLAHALAQSGARVLVVDLDPQATTTALTDADPGDGPSLFDVLADGVDLAEAIRPSPAWGVDVAPASLLMCRLEQATAPGSEFRLAEALTPVAGRYAHVLIDLPPSLGRLTLAGLIASRRALIVTEPSGPALRGVSDLLDTLDVVRRRYAPLLELAGVVANRVRPTREAGVRLDELRETFGDLLWEPHVPERAAVAEALGAHVPVDRLRLTTRSPAPSPADAFEALAGRMRKQASEQASKEAAR